ncbi:MAG: DUF1080 domain-containing protein [Puniceicoccales bacterium]|jgi:hypothetical protein|nr:DUF1080 domain-containing protein [Puniceicoccales bacterium]
MKTYARVQRFLLATSALAVGVLFFQTKNDAVANCPKCTATSATTGPYAPSPKSGFAGTRWALSFAGGWIGICPGKDGKLNASMLWIGGNPFPVNAIERGGKLIITREHKEKRRTVIETITGTRNGDTATFTQTWASEGRETRKPNKFTGKLIAPLPPRPDLSRLVFGEPIKLLSEGDNSLESNWIPMNRRAFNGWTLKNGVLDNNVIGPDRKRKHGTNLRTKATNFTDFLLSTEVNMASSGNSGIYLRGIYEIQMEDSFDAPLGNLHMGALYGRITPSTKAELPAGKWQKVQIILIDRHVSVTLNGIKIIDNQPILGITGGALSSNEFQPGPLYLQGDHTNVSYRNMTLTPIIGKK